MISQTVLEPNFFLYFLIKEIKVKINFLNKFKIDFFQKNFNAVKPTYKKPQGMPKKVAYMQWRNFHMCKCAIAGQKIFFARIAHLNNSVVRTELL